MGSGSEGRISQDQNRRSNDFAIMRSTKFAIFHEIELAIFLEIEFLITRSDG
jgi:hypothetical protein